MNEIKNYGKSNRTKLLNLSKHRIEEHDMLNWVKANRKRMNAGELKEPRLGKFKELLALSEQYKRKNQYE